MAASVSPGTPHVIPADGLERDLGWALGMVSRGYREVAMSAIEGLPAGPRGYHALAAVAEGESPSQLELARRLGIDKTVMTYVLDDLETAELVARWPDPRDRRARQVVITAEGTRALTRTKKRIAAAEAELLADLGADEVRLLRDLMTRLARGSRSSAPEGGSSAIPDCD